MYMQYDRFVKQYHYILISAKEGTKEESESIRPKLFPKKIEWNSETVRSTTTPHPLDLISSPGGR